jgi:hypothetical protein
MAQDYQSTVSRIASAINSEPRHEASKLFLIKGVSRKERLDSAMYIALADALYSISNSTVIVKGSSKVATMSVSVLCDKKTGAWHDVQNDEILATAGRVVNRINARLTAEQLCKKFEAHALITDQPRAMTFIISL